MKILIDTSVLSHTLRRANPSGLYVQKLQELFDSGQPLFICGLVLTEILSGVRHIEQLNKLVKHMEAFPMLELDRKGFVKAAQLRSHCRRNGVQCTTVDAIIAQTAINHGCRLFTADSDFLDVARYSDLQLL